MEKDIKNAEFEAMAEEEIQDSIVVLTDDEGNESYFIEEMVLPVGDKQFAILVGINEDCCEDEECHCHDHEDEERWGRGVERCACEDLYGAGMYTGRYCGDCVG